MADLEPGELKDLVNSLRDLVGALQSKMNDVADRFSAIAGFSTDIAEEILKTVKDSEKLSKHYKDIDKFSTRLLKDAKLRKKVEKETLDQIAKAHVAKIEEIKENGWVNKTREEYNKLLREAREEQELLVQSVKDQFANLEKVQKEQEKVRLSIFSASQAMDKMGNAIRHPATAIDSMLESVSAMPQKIYDMTKEGKGFAEIFKAFAAGGAIGLGVLAVLGPIILVWKAFKNLYDFIDKNVMPAQAAFNKQIGATSEGAKELKSQAASMGTEFYNMGLEFATGAEAVRGFAEGLNQVQGISKSAIRTGVELSEILGIGGESAGKLALQFKKAGESTEDLNKMMNLGAANAKKWGLPVNKVLKDMAKSPEVMLRFGLANKKAFTESAAKAQSYGLSIKEVSAAFGKQLDSFEASSTAAAKLNTIFGTNINSMKLMMETDPTKRMVMLRTELERQGKSWKQLSVFEKNVITSTMGVNEEQAALILSDKKERDALEKKAKQKEKNIAMDEKWNNGLRSLQATLLPLGQMIDKVMRQVANITAKLLGFDSGADAVTNTTAALKSVIDGVSGSLDEFNTYIDKNNLKGSLGTQIKDVVEWIKQIDFKATKKDLETLIDVAKGFGTALKVWYYASGMFAIVESLQAAQKLAGWVANKAGDSVEAEMNEKNRQRFAAGQTPGATVEDIEEVKKLVASGMNSPARERLLARYEEGLIKWDKIQEAALNASGGPMPVPVDDALVTKDGRVIKFNPGDSILASKADPSVTSSGAAMAAGSSGGGKQQDQVIHINLYLDSKKISEEQVRTSRY